MPNENCNGECKQTVAKTIIKEKLSYKEAAHILLQIALPHVFFRRKI